jgi:hypothetical protein
MKVLKSQPSIEICDLIEDLYVILLELASSYHDEASTLGFDSTGTTNTIQFGHLWLRCREWGISVMSSCP